jgi:uncharacterized membrane protein YvbJ
MGEDQKTWNCPKCGKNIVNEEKTCWNCDHKSDQIIDNQIAIELKETNSLIKQTNRELQGIKEWLTLIALLPFAGLIIGILALVLS